MIYEIDGRTYLNVTPHPISFQAADGSKVSLPCSGKIINARPVEVPVGFGPGGVELVETRFENLQADAEWLEDFTTTNPHVVVVGSIIAAQAYPRMVLAMVPLPGFERAAPADKRMNPNKFTTF